MPPKMSAHQMQPFATRAEQVIPPVAMQDGDALSPGGEVDPHLFGEGRVVLVFVRVQAEEPIIGFDKLLAVG